MAGPGQTLFPGLILLSMRGRGWEIVNLSTNQPFLSLRGKISSKQTFFQRLKRATLPYHFMHQNAVFNGVPMTKKLLE